jgi:hypothetical protein
MAVVVAQDNPKFPENNKKTREYRVLAIVCEQKHSVKQCETVAANPSAWITPILFTIHLNPVHRIFCKLEDMITSNFHKIYIGVHYNDNNDVNNSGCPSTQHRPGSTREPIALTARWYRISGSISEGVPMA